MSRVEEALALRARIQAALEAMPTSAATQLVGAVLDGAKLDEIDAEVVRDFAEPPEPDSDDGGSDSVLLAARGDAPGLGVLFPQVLEDVDASWREIIAGVAELVERDERSADLRATALLLLATISSWSELTARASSLEADGRLQRAALAAAAQKLGGDAATAFLRQEAARFFASLHERTTDTAALAAVELLRKHDPIAIGGLAEALRANHPHGASGRALVGLMGHEPAYAAPLEALVSTDFGRAAEGEPVAVAVAFAKAAPERARALLAPAETDSPERRAALLAGAVVADPSNAPLGEGLRALLDALDPTVEEQAAAALAVLRAVHQEQIEGFSRAAARWRSLKRPAAAELTRWLERHGGDIR